MTTTLEDRSDAAVGRPPAPTTAEALYGRALEFAREGVRGDEAVRRLLEDALDPSVLRHAHRLSEYEVMQGWPASPEAIKAFFYLSAARARSGRAPGPAEGSVA